MARIPQRLLVIAAVVLLLDVFAFQLLLSSERNSVTCLHTRGVAAAQLGGNWHTVDPQLQTAWVPVLKAKLATP